MGLYSKIKDNLANQFSIFQFISILRINASEVRISRNLLRQFHQRGFIKRISKNMYQKIDNQ